MNLSILVLRIIWNLYILNSYIVAVLFVLLFVMRAVAYAITLLIAPLRVEREIIVCWIGAHEGSAVSGILWRISSVLHSRNR